MALEDQVHTVVCVSDEAAHYGRKACVMVSVSCQQGVESAGWASGHSCGGLPPLTEVGDSSAVGAAFSWLGSWIASV